MNTQVQKNGGMVMRKSISISDVDDMHGKKSKSNE